MHLTGERGMTKQIPQPEIDPCLWCGFVRMVACNLGAPSWTVACPKCKAMGPVRKTPRGAINAWNRRLMFSKDELSDTILALGNFVYDYPRHWTSKRVLELKTKLEAQL